MGREPRMRSLKDFKNGKNVLTIIVHFDFFVIFVDIL